MEGGSRNGVKLNRWGYEVYATSDACISAINDYYLQVLAYGRKRSVILEAPVHDPQCVLANTLAAHFICSSDPSRAHSYMDAAKSQLEHSSSYEKAVFVAISCLISPDRDDDVAVQLYSKLLNDFPRDLMSLKWAQILCFYMGRPDLSLKLVQQVLPKNLEENYIYGMLAFPLLELCRMEDAEEAANKGFKINSEDPWLQHAVCHVLQYKCRFKEAVEFMEECSQSWSALSSFMYTHNWWHVALCYLEGHSPIRKVLEVYDNHIWKELEKSDASPAEVYLNAAGFLLRVYVRGEIAAFNDRLTSLSACLTNQAFWYLEWHLDLLSVWVLAVTGETAKAKELLKGLQSRTNRMSNKKQQLMQRGMLLAESLYEYGVGNDARALELLGSEYDANNCKAIGASNEQLDVFNEVYYTMLLNTGQATKAIEAIGKQLKNREGVPFLWRLLERGYLMLGRQEATSVGEKARAMETAYF